MNEKQNLEKSKLGGAREGAGHPPFVPTDEERLQVESLSGVGLPQDQIAVLIRDGIHLNTLLKYFQKELKAGKAKANSKIGSTLFAKAMNGDTTAAIFWAKTQMRWAETVKQEVTGADGGPVAVSRVERVIVDKNDNAKD